MLLRVQLALHGRFEDRHEHMSWLSLLSEVLNQLASYTSQTYYAAQCLVV